MRSLRRPVTTFVNLVFIHEQFTISLISKNGLFYIVHALDYFGNENLYSIYTHDPTKENFLVLPLVLSLQLKLLPGLKLFFVYSGSLKFKIEKERTTITL